MPAAGARNDRPVDGATQPCPNHHFFALTMSFAQEPERPAWWPKDRVSGYGAEKVKVTGGGIAPPERELDGVGGLRVDGIPAGSAKVQFEGLLKSVEAALEEGVRYETA